MDGKEATKVLISFVQVPTGSYFLVYIFGGKRIVQVYDYIDIHVPMCDVMYKRRLKGYASVGYKIQQNDSQDLFTRQLSDKDKILLSGVQVKAKEKLSLHTAIIYKSIVWYGSVNYLGSNAEDDNAIKIADSFIAKEVIKILYEDCTPFPQ